MDLANFLEQLSVILTTAGAGIIVYWLFRGLVVERTIPRAHSIAVIGQETSGKTTLITALFGELFARKILGFRAVPLGRSSVERVNEDLEKLANGSAVGPTRDQDMFAYRANLILRSGILSRVYKIEIADYSGKKSKRYSKKTTNKTGKDWSQIQGFESWINQADGFLFTVDLGRYLSKSSKSKHYVTEISTFIRSAWQNILNEHQDPETLDRKPIVLAFTKADLFEVSAEPARLEKTEGRIISLGFGGKVPKIKELNIRTIQKGENRVKKDFAELFAYFEGTNYLFQAIFVSSFGTINGRRLHFSKLIKSVMPTNLSPIFFPSRLGKFRN